MQGWGDKKTFLCKRSNYNIIITSLISFIRLYIIYMRDSRERFTFFTFFTVLKNDIKKC